MKGLLGGVKVERIPWQLKSKKPRRGGLEVTDGFLELVGSLLRDHILVQRPLRRLCSSAYLLTVHPPPTTTNVGKSHSNFEELTKMDWEAVSGRRCRKINENFPNVPRLRGLNRAYTRSNIITFAPYSTFIFFLVLSQSNGMLECQISRFTVRTCIDLDKILGGYSNHQFNCSFSFLPFSLPSRDSKKTVTGYLAV
ncbi:hypothetical protein BD410DRAFT_122212 [Rickenella mellea]|uniref:Uncharacterized protein n=1 Tax=Rickenella mellea TaxID=50990 RepID=A0A4Y7PIZ4_9AGAM|nr:hypothetical protein BD410DRAFT_122212 [Rickenella mellea]